MGHVQDNGGEAWTRLENIWASTLMHPGIARDDADMETSQQKVDRLEREVNRYIEAMEESAGHMLRKLDRLKALIEMGPSDNSDDETIRYWALRRAWMELECATRQVALIEAKAQLGK